MEKVLVTGIAGFIGSSIARELLKQGAQVRGIDDLSSGKMENIEDLLPQIDFRVGDVADHDAIGDACKDIDYVFHEAAVPSVPISVNDPIGTNGPNLNGTLAVLEASRKANVRRVMYAASSAAYGDSPLLPKTEAMLPEPISPYAVQKVAGEHYLASYTRVYGLETVSLRYFNIFGPRQDPTSQYSGVLAKFISMMTAGETPSVFGDGLNTRDFTYIDNVVSANILAAKAPSSVAGKVFNIATGRSVTLLEAFDAIKVITGFKGDVRFAPPRAGDVKHSSADISLAQTELIYRVVSSFEEGLEKTVSWYKQNASMAV